MSTRHHGKYLLPALTSFGHEVMADVCSHSPALIHVHVHVLSIRVEFYRLSAHHSRAA